MGKFKLVLVLLLLTCLAGPCLAKSGPAKRIVSLAPSVTEILFLLKAEKKLVGVTSGCDYPEAAKGIVKTGLFGTPNLEKIAALEPDLVITPDLGANPAVARLNDLGIKTVVLPSNDITDVLESVEVVGKLTGTASRAAQAVSAMRRKMLSVENAVSGRPKPNVLVVLWVNPNGIMSAGKRSYINEMIELAGGRNIAGDIDFRYPMLSSEYILSQNPDVVIFGGAMGEDGSVHELLSKPGLRAIKAKKTGRIYQDIEPDLLLRPGPRLFDGLEMLARKLHPEAFRRDRAL